MFPSFRSLFLPSFFPFSRLFSYSFPTIESPTVFSRLSLQFQSSPSSLVDVIRFVTTRLTKSAVVFGHGTNDPYEEALFMVCCATRITPAMVETMKEARLVEEEVEEIMDMLKSRIELRKPLAYVTKTAVLNELVFFVDERVIVPRSLIAEPLRDSLDAYTDPGLVKKVLDLCTGSGALAILAANAFPNAKVDAVDISAEAIEVAETNVRDHELKDRVKLYRSDMFTGLPQKVQYDVILCNPPYLTTDACLELPLEYKCEPKLALDGGKDGMNFIHVVMRNAFDYLQDGGILVLEIGGLKETFEKHYASANIEWINTSEGEHIVCVLRKHDLKKFKQAEKNLLEPTPTEEPEQLFFQNPAITKMTGVQFGQMRQKKSKRNK